MNPQFYSQTPFNIMSSFLAHQNFKPINPNSFCFQQYFPALSDSMVLKDHTKELAQVSATPRVHPLNDVKAEFLVKAELPVKFEGKYEYIPKPTKIEPESSDQDLSYSESSTTPSQTGQSLTQKELKSEIEKIVRFLFSNMGKGDETLVEKTRSSYLHNSCLLEVYDKISMRFYSAKKCKEDLIRYILRKIFRHLRTSIMRKEKVSSKKAGLLLCKRYLQHGEMPSDIEDEDKFLESLMPYNKNSKNKTMNITFILEIFSSASFCQEYQEFLPELNKLIVEENKKKEGKLVKFILECIDKKCLGKLTTVHRFPWLDVWMEDAKNLAIAIMPNKRLIYNSQKPKNF